MAGDRAVQAPRVFTYGNKVADFEIKVNLATMVSGDFLL